MTTFNTDYNNTELLDQELTIEQLEAVAGGRTIEELECYSEGWYFLDGYFHGSQLSY